MSIRVQAVDQGTELRDTVTYAHKAGWRGMLTRLLFGGLPLRALFLASTLPQCQALKQSSHWEWDALTWRYRSWVMLQWCIATSHSNFLGNRAF